MIKKNVKVRGFTNGISNKYNINSFYYLTTHKGGSNRMIYH
jgi:hypothetical protein